MRAHYRRFRWARKDELVHQTAAPTGSPATIYTNPELRTEVAQIYLANIGAGNQTVDLYHNDTSGTFTAANHIIRRTLAPNSTANLGLNGSCGICVAPGGHIGMLSTASTVVAQLFGYTEERANVEHDIGQLIGQAVLGVNTVIANPINLRQEISRLFIVNFGIGLGTYDLRHDAGGSSVAVNQIVLLNQLASTNSEELGLGDTCGLVLPPNGWIVGNSSDDIVVTAYGHAESRAPLRP